MTKEIKEAPSLLLIEIPRVTESGNKTNTRIKETPKCVTINENGRNIKYNVTGVIIHKGEESESGHYVLNYLNPNTRRWEQIDNHRIIDAKNFETENQQGVVYILTKSEREDQDDEEVREIQGRDLEQNVSAERRWETRDTSKYRRHNIRQRRTSQPRSDQPSTHPRNNHHSPEPQQYSSREEREYENIQKKKNNIIIRGLEEKGEGNDYKEVLQLNYEIGNRDFNRKSIINITRLGEYHGKPRPLKVEFDSYITKIQIMRNLRNLQDNPKYYGISLNHDLTKSQLIEYKNLINESKEKEEDDEEGEHIYRVRGPPGQWKIVRYPKNY